LIFGILESEAWGDFESHGRHDFESRFKVLWDGAV